MLRTLLALSFFLAVGAHAQDRVAVLASAGVGWAIDGASSNGQPGAMARIGVDLGPAEVAIEVHGGGPDTIVSPRVDYHVARGHVRLAALLEVIDDGEWRVPLGATIGITGWARLSTINDVTLEATDGATSGGFTFGVEGRVQWLPSFLSGIVGLDLTFGLDVVQPTPRFVIDDGASITELATLWPISPRWSLAILVRGRP